MQCWMEELQETEKNNIIFEIHMIRQDTNLDFSIADKPQWSGNNLNNRFRAKLAYGLHIIIYCAVVV